MLCLKTYAVPGAPLRRLKPLCCACSPLLLNLHYAYMSLDPWSLLLRCA